MNFSLLIAGVSLQRKTMGARGLLSQCLRNQNRCCTFVDLVKVAREENGVDILVDYCCFVMWIYGKFIHNLIYRTRNDLLTFYGGEYSSFSLYVSSLIKNLQSVNIYLTFLIDGVEGSCNETRKRKLDTWLYRSSSTPDAMKEMLSLYNKEKSLEDVESYILPRLYEMVLFSALTECGCKVVHFAGEADAKIAKRLLDSKAYAVFTNDSDFCIFNDCRFIPFELFDIYNDMKLENCGEFPKKPLYLQVGLISNKKVKEMLAVSCIFPSLSEVIIQIK